MWGHGRRRLCIASALGVTATVPVYPAVLAAAEPMTERGLAAFGSYETVSAAVLAAALMVVVTCALWLIHMRARAEATIRRLQDETTVLRAALDLAECLVEAEDQRLVAWDRDATPLVFGSLGAASGAPADPASFLDFATWLAPQAARDLDIQCARLKERGEAFALRLATRAGTFVEAVGRIAGGRAVLRFRDLTADESRHAEIAETSRRVERHLSLYRRVAEAIGAPIWSRDADGRLVRTNSAYARAVDAPDAAAAVRDGRELLDAASRRTLAEARRADGAARARLPLIVGGVRRVYDVVEIRTEAGCAGIAIDVTEAAELRAELDRTIASHARTLDGLATAVAIFGPDKRLQFHNAAYRALWGLDAAFLKGRPTDDEMLDRLRGVGKLPEQPNFRAWKRELHAGYRALETQSHWWYLPDGRALRVFVAPQPQGGVAYIYEDATEKLDLEKRYNALARVQGETLDHLSDAVAVFGSDGRLRLWNPSFVKLWHLPKEVLDGHPHISTVIELCRARHEDPNLWRGLAASVTGIAERRRRWSGRMARPDGIVLDFATVPLPDAATLVTFQDVTAAVDMERALREKNEALEQASEIKNEFIQRVSYELRSPLTNVVGFAHLLVDPKVGPLNEKQREYAGYVLSSSAALMALVNDILDLATIDAGIMQIEPGPVDIAAAVSAAAEGMQDRLREAGVTLELDLPPGLGVFWADEKRVRQILFNLISNAVAASRPGGTVEISARKRAGEIRFTVRDRGAGMPPDFVRLAFDRFVSRPSGNSRGGAGLGLAIVKSFVDLHGGRIVVESREGEGTVVVCRLPLTPGHRLEDEGRGQISSAEASHG